jgi:hypothetical protein
MKESCPNDIAALLSGALTSGEKAQVLRKAAKDPLALDALAILKAPESASEEPLGLAFPVTGVFRAGVCRGFLKVFDMRAWALSEYGKALAKRISHVSSGRFPLCFYKGIELDLPPETGGGVIRIVTEEKSEKLHLHVRTEDPRSLEGNIEIWENGSLLQSTPGNRASELTIPAESLGGAMSIKNTAWSHGAGLRFVPVEFQRADWLAACLCCGLEGEFVKASSILREELKGLIEESPAFSKLGGFVDAIRSLAKCENCVLVPVPAIRSAGLSEVSRVEALRTLWEGIVVCWPEARMMETPWNEEEADSTGALNLSPDTLHYIQAVVDAAHDPPNPESLEINPSDPNLFCGWMALKGWVHILSGDYGKGLETLESISITENDPFGVSSTVALAKHLMVTEDMEATEDDKTTSSNEVWRTLFSELMDRSASTEE